MRINYSSRTFAAWGCGAVATLLASGAAAQTFTRINTGPLATAAALESHSSAWADLENDGDLDVFVANTLGNNALYRNDGNGSFTAISSSPATSDGGATTGGAWGDYDNDGLLDVFFVNRWQDHFLYRGTGGFGFSKVTGSPATAGGSEAYHASWVDYDNDGFLDLYVVNVSNVNYLYRNNGNGTFTKNTSSILANTSGAWIGSFWADYNGDGLQDVLLLKAGGNLLYRNTGNGGFSQVLSGPVVTDSGLSSAAAWGDYDNDADLDLFISNRQGVNFLYRNDGGSFTRITQGTIASDSGDSNGAMWGDYDNDGWLDLHVTRGDLPPNQTNLLYRNNGNGTFTRVTTGPHVTDSEQSLSGVWVDYDNDGSLDLFVTNAGTNSLYRNSGAAGNWLKLKLVGQLSNRSAIGAKIFATATINGVQQTLLRQVSGEAGFHGQNLELHFGLGAAPTVTAVRVEWPSGTFQTISNVGANQRLTITETVSTSPTLVIPAGLANVDGNFYSGTLHENQLRLQAVYSTANFPSGSRTITELRFRRDFNEPPFSSATAAATVRLSTTSRNPGGLSTTFSENPGPDEVTVFNGNWTYSSPTVVPQGTVRPFEIALPLTTPFTYNPANGNLLFDIRITSNSNLNWTDGSSGGQVSRVASLNANAITGDAETTGDVLQLVYQASPILAFFPPTGMFTNSVQVSIQSGYPNSFIRYTTDGNDPTVSSTTYTGPFTVTETTTVKARLFVNGFPASEIAAATYTRYVPPDIQFVPPGQLFTNQLNVTLVNNVGGGTTIRYTLNGSAPTSASTAYVPGIPINLTAAATIRAQVYFGNFFVSEVFTEDYARVYAFANDGVPFAWREQYFGPDFLTDPCAAADADCDDDGYVVAEEYQYATDPTDGNSAPEILLSVRAVPRLTFNTIAGRSYRIQRTTTLNPPNWQTIVESVLATGPELHYVDEEAPDNSYYQVELIRN